MRCPYCGYDKGYEYYLIRFVMYVGMTWVACEFLESKIHVGKMLVKLVSKLF